MLDMGFIKPVRQIAAAIGKNRQTALFSATMPPEIAKLAESLLNDPVRVEATPQGTTVGKIDQQVILSGAKHKRDKLNELLADDSLSRVVIFSRTKHGADKVAKNLEIDGHSVAAIHGNKNQNARQNALRGFRDGKVRILVATDIVARGIDVPDISHVINYELPDDPENYVHRIGRTGRNGASGVAITLVDGTERSKVRAIERLIRKTLPVSGELPAGEPTSKPKPQGRSRPNSGAPQRPRNGESRPQNGRSRSASSGGNKGWWSKLDAEAPKPADGESRSRPAKGGKKPRWNKNRKDVARVAKGNAARYGASVA
jgi:ATP-dependent RNA helicase RhlE